MDFKKIVALDNQMEAKLLEATLKEHDIPHMIKSYHDSALDGLFQAQKGWGQVMAPLEYKEEIKAILEDLRANAPELEEDVEDMEDSLEELEDPNQS
jgi:hypothetical protein